MQVKKKTQIAAVYLRVSTKKQADGGTAISGQLKAINDLLSREGIQCYKVYTDEGKTGTNENRPALREMLADAHRENPPFNLILLWDVSRFDRHFQNWVNHVYTLRAKGINIRTVDSHLNLDDPMHEMMAMFTGLQAAQFSVTLSKNTRRGMNETIRHGFFPYGRAPYGYDLQKVPFGNAMKNKLIINPEEAKVVKTIFRLATQDNMGGKKIAAYLNENGYRHHEGQKFSFKTVLKILRNEVYTGKLIGDKTVTVNGRRIINSPDQRIINRQAHDAIIEEKVFNQAAEAIGDRKNNREEQTGKYSASTANSAHLFGGIAFCGLCGAPMSSTTGKGRHGSIHFYYTCSRRRTNGRAECNLGHLNQRKLDRMLLTEVENRILTRETIFSVADGINKTQDPRMERHAEALRVINRELTAVTQRIDKIAMVISNHNTEAAPLLPTLNKLERERISLENKRDDLVRAQPQQAELRGLDDLISRLSLALATADLAQRKRFMAMIVHRVDIYPDKAVIRYRNPFDPTRNSIVAPFNVAGRNKKDPKTSPNDGVRFWVSYASPRGIEPLLRE